MQAVFHYSSPLGGITAAGDEKGLCGLWFDGQKYFGSTLAPEREEGDLPLFRDLGSWLDRYFSGRDPGPCPPLDLKGTPFQLAVWEALQNIPYGRVITYGELAGEIEARTGKRTSPRAVGAAVGRNPLSLLVPCHRVVGRAGLTGYAGGLDKKRALLELEGAPLPRLT